MNYAGFVSAALGLGQAARGYVKALREQGFEVSTVDAEALLPGWEKSGSHDLSAPLKRRNFPHPVNIIHINPDLIYNFWHLAGREFFENRYTIGIWAWETPVFPARWYDRFNLVNEIWVGGSFMARGITMASPVPVLVIPHAVETSEEAPDRNLFGLSPDEYIFLFSFDFNSSPIRKNPCGVIEAFRKAFDPTEPARLVIKSINGARRPEERKRMKDLCRDLRVTFIDEVLTDRNRSKLLASCDAFVSLHRAEGFGLGIAEGMAAGKPVVATGWSGNMDFMNVGNSFPVDFSLAPLESEDPPYEEGSLWAVPDTDDAAEKMRRIFEDRALADRVGKRARQHMEEFHGIGVIGGLMRERLCHIGERGFTGTGKRNAFALLMRRYRMNRASFLLKVWFRVLRVLPNRWHPGLRKLTERSRSHESGML